MKKARVALLIALLLNSVCTFAQPQAARTSKEFTDSLDAYIRKTMERLPDIPGLAVIVIKDDKPIFVRAYGTADQEAGIRADTDTLFYIASSTKAFTALGAAMLDQEGKIRFSDPVTKYAAGVSFKNQIPDKVTVRDLLTHTSGLKNNALVNRLAFSGQIDQREIDHVFAAGTTYNDEAYGKYAYDNLGYNIYGLLLQNSLKTRWQDLLQKRVFDPSGLRHTTARISNARARKWNIAAPYILDPSQGKIIRSVLDKTDDNMQSAGGMFMSISDLGRWINLNMNAGKLDGRQVIPADLIRNAHTGYTKSTRNSPPFVGEGEYGLGWQIGKYRDEKVIYHHGGFVGYRSHVSFMPDKKIGVGVLANNDLVGGFAADMVATYALDWWLNTENVEAEYAKKLQDLFDNYEKRKSQVHSAALERAKRTWQLTKPFADYAGKYRNDIHGTIEISARENALAVRMGKINTVSTPFTEKDTIRVEMLPGGNGEVIKFNKEADDRVVSLNYANATFTRVP
jgi:CubicO group peptidase (beta-lactamase class C family)